jgi:hypothetical protein
MSKYEARFNDNVESPRWRVVDEHSTVAICGNDQEGAERIAAALNAYDDGQSPTMPVILIDSEPTRYDVQSLPATWQARIYNEIDGNTIPTMEENTMGNLSVDQNVAGLSRDIVELAGRRVQLADLNAQIASVEAAMRQQHQALYEARDLLKQLVEDAYQAVTDAGRLAFQQSGNKHPHEAVTIRVMRRPVYDATQALSWAKLSGIPDLVSLNKQKFETLARTVALPFVDIVEEPQAAIDQDLSAYLPEAQRPKPVAPARPGPDLTIIR